MLLVLHFLFAADTDTGILWVALLERKMNFSISLIPNKSSAYSLVVF